MSTSPLSVLVPFASFVFAVPAPAQSAGTPMPPALLNAPGATDATPDAQIAIAMDASGRAVAVFTAVDPVAGDLDVHFSFSHDQGASWFPSTAANASIANSVGEDVEPTVGAHFGGWRYAFARRSAATPGEHDIFWGGDSGNPDGFSNNGALQSDAAGDAFDDRVPHLASTGATASTVTSICVWQRESAAGDEDVCFARFANSIGSWSPTAFLHGSFAADVGRDLLPRVAGDGAGTWVCVWESTSTLGGTIGSDTDVLCSRSTDDGLTWSAPAALNSTAATDGSATDRAPRIEHDAVGGAWLVVWQSTSSLGGTIGADEDVLYARSTDGGLTWSAAAALNPDAATDHLGGADDDQAPDVSVDGSGRFVAVWQREHSSAAEYDLQSATSVDGGLTWTAFTPPNTNAATDSGADVAPSVAAGSDGQWIVAWISDDDLGGTIGTDRDVLATRFLIPDSSSPGTRFCFGFDHGGVRCPCGNDSNPASPAGCLNSTGVGASASLNGTASLSGPSCRALCSGLPPNVSALVFQGTSGVSFGEGSAFGDGLRCVGGAVVRIDTLFASSVGQVNTVLPKTGLVAGDQRAYQAWYRNAADFCTASTFNLSSAFWATWRP